MVAAFRCEKCKVLVHRARPAPHLSEPDPSIQQATLTAKRGLDIAWQDTLETWIHGGGPGCMERFLSPCYCSPMIWQSRPDLSLPRSNQSSSSEAQGGLQNELSSAASWVPILSITI
eukprot:683317-Pelagomonas_calceolata.AAC.3